MFLWVQVHNLSNDLFRFISLDLNSMHFDIMYKGFKKFEGTPLVQRSRRAFRNHREAQRESVQRGRLSLDLCDDVSSNH